MQTRHGGGVRDGGAIARRMIERHQDACDKRAPADRRPPRRRSALFCRRAAVPPKNVIQPSSATITASISGPTSSDAPGSGHHPRDRHDPGAARNSAPRMTTAALQASTLTQRRLANSPMRARSLVKRISGITANGSCMLRITWLRISSSKVPCSPAKSDREHRRNDRQRCA